MRACFARDPPVLKDTFCQRFRHSLVALVLALSSSPPSVASDAPGDITAVAHHHALLRNAPVPRPPGIRTPRGSERIAVAHVAHARESRPVPWPSLHRPWCAPERRKTCAQRVFEAAKPLHRLPALLPVANRAAPWCVAERLQVTRFLKFWSSLLSKMSFRTMAVRSPAILEGTRKGSSS